MCRITLGIIKAPNRFAFTFLALFIFSFSALSQTDTIPVVKDAIKANREKTYRNIVNNSITKNLSLPLSDSTEENWQDAFNAIEVIKYKAPWINERINTAFESIGKRSTGFQRALLELLYANYPLAYNKQVKNIFDTVTNYKILAMCGEYLLLPQNNVKYAMYVFNHLDSIVRHVDTAAKNNPFCIMLAASALSQTPERKEKPESRKQNLKTYLPYFLKPAYLKGEVILYSFQRKNRNYPGLAIIRTKEGNIAVNKDGSYFNVPQLARSISNLPGYLTNGNTPQGIFKMYGFDVSKSAAIGPTENIQMGLPVELSKQVFFKDSTIENTEWVVQDYNRLLPQTWRKNFNLYQAFYAGLAGRSEIIAHGTTVNPEYYKGQSYYPHSPTVGCLCTKEIWNPVNGKRTESNQQKLVDALKKAGGADGYVIVIELEDKNQPVTLQEILPYIKAATEK